MAQEKTAQSVWKVLLIEGAEPQKDLTRLKEPGVKYSHGFRSGMPA